MPDRPNYRIFRISPESFFAAKYRMPDDELEHLRAILAGVHASPPKGMRTIMRQIAKGFFATPKKVIIERIRQQDPPKKDAA